MSELSAEAAILHAVIDEDFDRARELIAGMLPGERRALTGQAYVLADLLKARDRLMAVGKGKCRWDRDCRYAPAGYYLWLGSPVAICAHHRPEAQERDIAVLDLPTEVTL